MSSASNTIRWFESTALDKPELRSPQPCKRGIHCDYKLTDEATGELVRACCSAVHPGEEGTGRRLFPARITEDGREQPACVRLTGASHGFYERRRLRLSWAEWCERHDIPFTPALPGQPFEPLVRVPLGGKPQSALVEAEYDAPVAAPLAAPLAAPVAAPVAAPLPQWVAELKLTKNQRKRRNKRLAEQVHHQPSPPSPLFLSPRVYRDSFAVSARGGECSPDCSCPTGFSCGDRSRHALVEVSHDTATPTLTPVPTAYEIEAELRAGAHSPKPQSSMATVQQAPINRPPPLRCFTQVPLGARPLHGRDLVLQAIVAQQDAVLVRAAIQNAQRAQASLIQEQDDGCPTPCLGSFEKDIAYEEQD